MHVACGHGSILVWWQCSTSGFVNDVMFSRNWTIQQLMWNIGGKASYPWLPCLLWKCDIQWTLMWIFYALCCLYRFLIPRTPFVDESVWPRDNMLIIVYRRCKMSHMFACFCFLSATAFLDVKSFIITRDVFRFKNINFRHLGSELGWSQLMACLLRLLSACHHKKHATLFFTITLVFLGGVLHYVPVETGMNTMQKKV